MEPPNACRNLEGILIDLRATSLDDTVNELRQRAADLAPKSVAKRSTEKLIPGREKQGVVGTPDLHVSPVLVEFEHKIIEGTKERFKTSFAILQSLQSLP